MTVARRAGLVVVAIALAGCGDGRQAPPAGKPLTPPADALTKVTEEGPVKATVKVWPTAPQLGDAIHLELTIEAQPQVMVSAPREPERLGRFLVVDATSETRRRDDGASIEIQRYELQAPGSGKHRLPPIRIEATDTRAASSAPTELLTEEVPVTVAMVDPARAAQELAAARGTLDASTVDRRPLWLALFALALIAGAVASWFGLRRVRQARDRKARISAYQVAVRRLTELEHRGPPDAEAADGWFVELSAIVRHYLEGRYQVRAPELTTEEFLQEARRAAGLSAGFSVEHREMLTAFLERCDRVKFAGYRPDAEESLATLKAARAFVEDTRLRLTEVP